jgi:hypothetical protein
VYSHKETEGKDVKTIKIICAPTSGEYTRILQSLVLPSDVVLEIGCHNDAVIPSYFPLNIMIITQITNILRERSSNTVVGIQPSGSKSGKVYLMKD